MKLLRIVPDNTKFGFMRFRRVSFPFSAFLSVVSVFCFFFVSMNFGIDFTGGTLIEMQAKTGKADIAAVREAATDLSLGEVEVQEFGEKGDVSVRFGLQPTPAGATQIEKERVQQAALERVKSTFEKDFEFRRTEVVGPRVSGELVQSGTLGVVLSVLAVLVYLWFRFEWQFAVGAVIATLHDLVLTIGFFAISQIEFNMTSIAAILTIVGYSLNDTVVVFDRIREMLRKYKKMPTEELLDISMNSTLSRTVMTSVTTSLALIALVLFGGTVIESFSWAMMFGVVIGTYSSIFIAAAGADLSRRQSGRRGSRRRGRGRQGRRQGRRQAYAAQALGGRREPGAVSGARRAQAGPALRGLRSRPPPDRRLRQGRLPVRRDVAPGLHSGAAVRRAGLGPALRGGLDRRGVRTSSEGSGRDPHIARGDRGRCGVLAGIAALGACAKPASASTSCRQGRPPAPTTFSWRKAGRSRLRFSPSTEPGA